MSDETKVLEIVATWDQNRRSGREHSIDELCKETPELVEAVNKVVCSIRGTDWLEDELDSDGDYLTIPKIEQIGTVADTSKPAKVKLNLQQFRSVVIQSNVLTENQLDKYSSRSSKHPETARDLAISLTKQGVLTSFQARTLLRGKTKGLVLGDYVVMEQIGEGGMGKVFQAKHRRMKRNVALKILRDGAIESSQAVKRFQREVQAAALLDHKNIVTAHDAGEADGIHYLVMQLVEGEDLSKRVRSNGPLPWPQAIDYLTQAARGVAYAHQNGIVHRDIKPANLLVDNSGNLQILDMGLARIETSGKTTGGGRVDELTADGSVMGTVDYMAPEQAKDTKVADTRSDVYSLGCTLYYLLTGQPIYSGENLVAKIIAHREDPVPELAEVCETAPPELFRIFEKMVAKNPQERFQSADELVVALENITPDSFDSTEIVPASIRASKPEALVDTSNRIHEKTEELAKPRTATLPRRTSTAGSRNFTRWAAFLGCALLVGALGIWIFQDTILRVKTSEGLVVIESTHPDIEVFVDNEKQEVELVDPADGKRVQIRIKPGSKMMTVSKNGFKADVSEFQLSNTDDESQTIKISFKPNTEPPVASGSAPSILSNSSVAAKVGKNNPIHANAFVRQPQPLKDAISWSIETIQSQSYVWDCEFSPNDQFVATCGADSRLRIYDSNDASLHRVFVGAQGNLRSLSWSPDSQFVATTGDDGLVRIWHVASGRLVKKIDGEGQGFWVGWSSNGTQLAYRGGHAGKAGVVIYDLENDSVSNVLEIEKYLNNAAWSPDGTRVATAARDEKITIWNVAEGAKQHELNVPGDSPICVSWSADGNQLVSSGPQKVVVWDAQNGRQVKELSIPIRSGVQVSWAQDNQHVFSVDAAHGAFQKWSVADDKPVFESDPGTFELLYTRLSHAGDRIVAGGVRGEARIWDASTGKKLLTLSPAMNFVKHLDWSSDLKTVTAGHVYGDGQFRQWKIGGDGVTMGMKMDSTGSQHALLKPGQVILAAGEVQGWDLESENKLWTMLPETGGASWVRLSSTKTKLAVLTSANKMEVWDVASKGHIRTFEGESSNAVSAIRWSPDEKMIALANNGGHFQVWDVETGKQIYKSEEPTQYRGGIAWSPDSKQLLIRDRIRLAVWDSATHEITNQYLGDSKIPARNYWTADLQWLAKTNQIVGYGTNYCRFDILDSKSFKILSREMDGAQTSGSAVYGPITFSQDETRMIATEGANIWFWDWTNKKRDMVIVPIGPDHFVAISSDGNVCGNAGFEKSIVYVVQFGDRQQTFTATEFATQFGWKNDPSKCGLR